MFSAIHTIYSSYNSLIYFKTHKEYSLFVKVYQNYTQKKTACYASELIRNTGSLFSLQFAYTIRM